MAAMPGPSAARSDDQHTGHGVPRRALDNTFGQVDLLSEPTGLLLYRDVAAHEL
jgi:hypothetical protein